MRCWSSSETLADAAVAVVVEVVVEVEVEVEMEAEVEVQAWCRGQVSVQVQPPRGSPVACAGGGDP
jgi:hypothetical protein